MIGDVNLSAFNLDANTKLSTLTWKNEADWEEIRRAGIGGSDIGAIMGINKYASALTIYKAKVEGIKKDLSDNVNVRKGKELEDYILNHFVRPELEAKGYVVGKPAFMIINSDYPFFRANVDGIAYKPGSEFKDNLIVEIKYVSQFAEEGWGKPDEYRGVPAGYYAQVQEYMLVTGADNAMIFPLYDSDWKIHPVLIPRDELFIAKMIIAGRNFYEHNMVMKIPPMISITKDKDDAIKAIKEAPKPLTPSKDMDQLCRDYKLAEVEVKKAKEISDQIKDKILDMHLKGFKPEDPAFKVNLSVVKSSRFNSTKFKAEHPGVYEEYCEDSETSRFTVK